MKTKVLLIVLLMFLVNVVPLNAQETIKACGTQKVIEGWNILNFPSDGSKPHGRYIGWFLTLTNKLKLELVVEKVEDFKAEQLKLLETLKNDNPDLVARNCPLCGIEVIKETGCNAIVCMNSSAGCTAKFCIVCGKIFTDLILTPNELYNTSML